MAWLQAVPDPPDGDKSNRPGKPRRETLEDHGITPELPEVDALYLANYLFEAGPGISGFSGLDELSSTELRNWQAGEGIPLLPWEFSLIRRLSRVYVNEYRAATKRGHKAPWKPEVFGVADQLDSASRLEAAMDREIDL